MEQFRFPIFTGTFIPEADARRCSIEKVLPATLIKNSSGAGVSCEYCKMFQNTFFYRTPSVAASFILKSLDFNYFAVHCFGS